MTPSTKRAESAWDKYSKEMAPITSWPEIFKTHNEELDGLFNKLRSDAKSDQIWIELFKHTKKIADKHSRKEESSFEAFCFMPWLLNGVSQAKEDSDRMRRMEEEEKQLDHLRRANAHLESANKELGHACIKIDAFPLIKPENMSVEIYLRKVKVSKTDLATPKQVLQVLIDATIIKLTELEREIGFINRTTQKNREKAQLITFARCLFAFFKLELGKGLMGTTANITNAVFDLTNTDKAIDAKWVEDKTRKM